MIKLFRRWWGYLNAKLTGKFNEMADPTVQLEQALREAQDQHRRLKEQAANVIASQKQAELRLNKRMTDRIFSNIVFGVTFTLGLYLVYNGLTTLRMVW